MSVHLNTMNKKIGIAKCIKKICIDDITIKKRKRYVFVFQEKDSKTKVIVSELGEKISVTMSEIQFYSCFKILTEVHITKNIFSLDKMLATITKM